MKLSRRALAAFVPALIAAAGRVSAAERLPTMVINREDAPVRKGNTTSLRFFDGLTHKDMAIEAHETELPAGKAPHPPHRHVHEELLILREGVLEVTIEGKASKILKPGGLIYIASNEDHGWKNVSDVTAYYVVVAIGREA